MRRDEKTTENKVLDLKVKGIRPRGRPRTSWLKYIDNILKERGTNLKKWKIEVYRPQQNRLANISY